MSETQQLERLKAALAGRYGVERMLGAGGMSDVYLAEDIKHHRKVAIKVLKPELAAALGPDRFLREIEIAANLTHPNILPLHDSGQAGGFLYYVMPYVEGESLRERLSREKQLAIPEAVRVLKEIVDALAHAHAHHIVHRDIKPANVMLSGRHALVTDFGIAKALSDATVEYQLTSVGAALGTPQYMAPEQGAGDPNVDHRADIYAVGVLAYELLTGRAPFEAQSLEGLLGAHMRKNPQPIRLCRPDVPSSLDEAVMRCLAKRPTERWQTAAELLTALESILPSAASITPAATPIVRSSLARRRAIVGALAAMVPVVAAVLWFTGALGARKNEKWLRTEAIPEIRRLVEADDVTAAHLLAIEADASHPGDALLSKVWDGFTDRVSITTEPPGAKVFWREYAEGQDWRLLGTTPLQRIRFPRSFYRLRFELNGYQPYETASTSGWLIAAGRFPLDKPGAIPESVTRVPGGRFGVQSPGLEGLTPLELADYVIDRYEVTNRRYKTFIDNGGYSQREYWQQPFSENGRTLTWDDAVARFVDQTGRTGPAGWQLSDYPKGHDDEPVVGVSWYEAAAYARFEGRDLPTIYHWNHAAGTSAARWIVLASNFSEKGIARVGQFRGMSRFGAFDMAGNAREWCFNQDLGRTDARFILGGGWDDAAYMFSDVYTQSAWDRSPTNGFRLVTYPSGDTNIEKARAPVRSATRDFLGEAPVADAEFKVYKRMYAYDRKPLNASIERTDTSDDWVRQRISFDAAYGHERMIAYLFLPKRARPPYQTIVYFPGSSSIFQRSIDDDFTYAWDFIVKGGRALMYPVYRGTFDRQTELNTDLPNETVAYRDYMIQWARDLGRSIDYLETRNDIASDDLGYFGFSWGGRLGGLLLAVEPRLKAAVLHVAGLKFQRALPEADPFNFVPRVTIPVLMLNGKYDQFFPLATSQIPMFKLLGTPPENKRQVVYDTGHFVPRVQLSKETLDWYDHYLGRVGQ